VWFLAASSGWQTVLALAGPLVGVPTSVVAVLAFKRTARVADAKASAEAIGIGLDYVRTGIAEQRQAMEQALAHQQDVIREQQGMIGELRGELKGCREERRAMADEITELKRAIS
jgi:hypothetical protein